MGGQAYDLITLMHIRMKHTYIHELARVGAYRLTFKKFNSRVINLWSKQVHRDKIFSISLAEIRLQLGVVNAILIGLAVGLTGSKADYVVVFSYLFLNLVFLLIPVLRYMVTRPLRLLVLGMDLAVTGWMMARTGGAASPLYAFLFIPVLLSMLRFRYPGVIICCTGCALFLIAVTLGAGFYNYLILIPRIAYLYLAGIVGSYLINHTYTVTEEVSKKLARWNIELQRLNNFSLEVTGSHDLDQIFNQTLKTVLQSNPSQMAAIAMFNDQGLLKIFASTGWDEKWLDYYDEHPLNLNSFTLAPIIIFKNPLLCSDIKKHTELVRVFSKIPVEALFAFPLVVDGEVVGVLMITSPKVRQMSDQETQILTSIANQAGIAVQNVVSLRQERKKADTDGLTGLFNRRYFNEQIEELTRQALAHQVRLSLIMVDVDDFKKYNDTYGHPAGDQLLKEIAAAIADTTREQDIAARYGGEEFAVILYDTSNQMALLIADRIRLAVARIPSNRLKCPVTISAGVATLPDHARDRATLVDRADRFLYQAKNSGKNQVCCG